MSFSLTSPSGKSVYRRAFLLALATLLFLVGMHCKQTQDDSDVSLPAALALVGVDTNCGTIDLGNTQRAPLNRPSFAEAPLNFSVATDGNKYLAVVLLENVPAGQSFVVKTGSSAAAFAFADFTCPVDQGANNGDNLPNSVVLRTADSSSNTFTIQVAGSYALVVTANSNPGLTVTLRQTN